MGRFLKNNNEFGSHRMITLSKSQLDKLAKDESFTIPTQAYKLIKSHLPELRDGLNEREFKVECENQIKRAYQYGIRDQNEVLNYVVAAFVFGENFDTEIGIFKKILSSRTITKTISKGNALNKVSEEIFKAADES